MLYSFIHPGSGLGNQLHRYLAGKVLALDKGYEYSAIGKENFKGKSFMNLDFGPPNPLRAGIQQPAGKLHIPGLSSEENVTNRGGYVFPKLWEEKTLYYNPEFNFIEDKTIIDGEFQDERYFEHRLSNIDEWLQVEPIDIPEDVCVIGFRGGEFYTAPELGLPKSYYDEAIAKMREINPDMKFVIHTDDAELAHRFFDNKYVAIHDIGINWRSMRYAKYAIVANSSFYILPRLLKQRVFIKKGDSYELKKDSVTIAPRYWDRYNIRKWERPYNYYKCFTYL